MDFSVFRRSSKLKWDRSTTLIVIFLAISLLYIPILIWEGEKFGTQYTSLAWGGIIILFGFLYLFVIYIPVPRVKGIVFILFLIIGTMAWHYQLKKMGTTFFSDKTYNAHLILFLVFAALSVPYLFRVKRKVKIHFRKIFELAATPLKEVQDGFTGRPYPVGKWQYSMQDIHQFAQFLHKNMIAFPKYYDNRTLLTFSARMMDPRKQDPENSSFIAFDVSGNITVNISKEDYSQYKSNFTFEQLCQSLSQVFKEMFEKYRAGKQDEIVQVMESFEPRWVKPLQIGLFIFLSVSFLVLVIIWFLSQ